MFEENFDEEELIEAMRRHPSFVIQNEDDIEEEIIEEAFIDAIYSYKESEK